jgi:heme a synthase
MTSFLRAGRVRPVAIWLFAVAALVLVMVVVGGATRLTDSGLSLTQWRQVTGVIPPLSMADWQAEFARYRLIPQYRQLNPHMSLADFRSIYWWEWTHRFLGRLIGVAFLAPFVFFLATGQIARSLWPKLAGIFVLGGLQGFIGWFMVRSGLADRIDVSQYRLALHLGLAVAILGALLWLALSLGAARHKAARRTVGGLAAWIVGLVFVQIVLGAFVAGLKAGLAYNTWPLMDGQVVPSGLGAMQPWYLNLFENAMTVQFNHRMAAYILLGAVLWHAVQVLRGTRDPGGRRTAMILAGAVLAQALLGIWTLLAQVPLALGLAHQAGAAAVFAIAVWHLHAMRTAA